MNVCVCYRLKFLCWSRFCQPMNPDWQPHGLIIHTSVKHSVFRTWRTALRERDVTRFSCQAKHERKHWYSTTDSFCVVMLQILTGGLCWFVALISCFTHLNTESAASLVTLLLSIIEELAVRREPKWEAGLWKCLISFPIIPTNRGQ